MSTLPEKIFEFLSRGTTHSTVRAFLVRVLVQEQARQREAQRRYVGKTGREQINTNSRSREQLARAAKLVQARRVLVTPAFSYFVALLGEEDRRAKAAACGYTKGWTAKHGKEKRRRESEAAKAATAARQELDRPKPHTWSEPVWEYFLELLVPCLSAEQARLRAKRSRLSPGEVSRKKSEWKKANPAKHREHKKRWRQGRRAKALPEDKILAACRSRLADAVKAQGGSKSARTRELLGCPPEFLRAHLEAQFTPGISWETYGPKGWHIDHIKPCAKFDLTKPEEQRACFHFTNLQPLWWYDNSVIKRDRYAA
jgi:hypothetical protein